MQGEPRPSQLLEDDLKEVLARGSKVRVGRGQVGRKGKWEKGEKGVSGRNEVN